MSGLEKSPHLKKVLHSYKSQANHSLQGPGPRLHLQTPPKDVQDNLYSSKSGKNYKKAMLYGRGNLFFADDDLKPAPPPSPSLHPPPSPTPIKKEKRDYYHAASVTPSSSPKDEELYDSPLVPPPPPLSMPVFAPPDTTGRPTETMLEGEPISSFMVGGEPRLCFPQVLNRVLGQFTLHQVNTVSDDLRIYIARCSQRQLDFWKRTGVLPNNANYNCGLITKTDAVRLTHALIYDTQLHSRPDAPPIDPLPSPPPQGITPIRVSHSCFGKCKGIFQPHLYTSPSARCIQCEECGRILTPTHFVCHGHHALEKQVCHWGFDAENWRVFLRLGKGQSPQDERDLMAAKDKFDPNVTNSLKRKQSLSECGDEAVKKHRGGGGDAPSPYLEGSSQPQLGAIPPVNCWSPTSVIVKDGKVLSVPHMLIRDSRLSLPPYLQSQGPPVLADPGRVVPLSECKKFERNYQPNVTLAPPQKGGMGTQGEREKGGHDKEENSTVLQKCLGNISERHVIQLEKPLERRVTEVGKEIVLVKVEHPPKLISASEAPHVSASEAPHLHRPTHDQAHPKHKKEENNSQNYSPKCHPRPPSHRPPPTPSQHPSTMHNKGGGGEAPSPPQRNGFPPDLELSTTDSDTESITSVQSKSEIQEEAEALMRGWSDRAAVRKMAQLVESLTKELAEKEASCRRLTKDNDRLKLALSKQGRQGGGEMEEMDPDVLPTTPQTLSYPHSQSLKQTLKEDNDTVTTITVDAHAHARSFALTGPHQKSLTQTIQLKAEPI